jgi:hypothetical protein
MVAPTTIGARLTTDGTLYVNRGSINDQNLNVGFDETGLIKTGHSVTKTNVFAQELDEVTLQNHLESGGSIALNGTNQRIDLAGSGDFQFGTKDFTIEGWFYITSTSYIRFWSFPDGDNLETGNNGTLYYWNGGGSITSSGAGVIPQNAWFHLALCKHNGEVTVYVNGTNKITDMSPFNSNTSRPLSIGGEVGSLAESNSATAGWLNGNFTNFRVVKGISIYTSDFDTPYTPYSDTEETVLLLAATDAGHLVTDSSSRNKSVTNVGNATFSSSTPLSTIYNGSMKQMKTGTLRVANEFDETTVLS